MKHNIATSHGLLAVEESGGAGLPTHRRVQVPIVVVAHFDGDKLAHEHIYWDQASVLVQVGLLNPENLPIAGAEIASKVLDHHLPSNALMLAEWAESENQDPP